jgi:hypothetical protein
MAMSLAEQDVCFAEGAMRLVAGALFIVDGLGVAAGGDDAVAGGAGSFVVVTLVVVFLV